MLSAKHWESTTAEVFIGFVGRIRQQVEKPLTVILDNASLHKAKGIVNRSGRSKALANHGSALLLLTDGTLKNIAHKLTDKLRKNISMDWGHGASARACAPACG